MLSDDWLVDEFEAMDLSRSCLSDAKAIGFHPHRYNRGPLIRPLMIDWYIDVALMGRVSGLYRCAT